MSGLLVGKVKVQQVVLFGSNLITTTCHGGGMVQIVDIFQCYRGFPRPILLLCCFSIPMLASIQIFFFPIQIAVLLFYTRKE